MNGTVQSNAHSQTPLQGNKYSMKARNVCALVWACTVTVLIGPGRMCRVWQYWEVYVKCSGMVAVLDDMWHTHMTWWEFWVAPVIWTRPGKFIGWHVACAHRYQDHIGWHVTCTDSDSSGRYVSLQIPWKFWVACAPSHQWRLIESTWIYTQGTRLTSPTELTFSMPAFSVFPELLKY